MTQSFTLEAKPIVLRTGVCGIALENQKILLVKEYKGPHLGKFGFPGGGIEPGEVIEEALRREFCEEVGMTFDSLKLFDNLTAITEGIDKNNNPYLLHQVGLIYLVYGLAMLPNQHPELEYQWIDLKTISPSMLTPFVVQSLEKIKTQ